MPWETTGREIKEFFRDSKISEHDIHLAPNEDGKACGVGFACFYDDEDARKAMQRNGAYMGKRYVELFLSSKAEMDKALKDGVPSIPELRSPKQDPRTSRGGRSKRPSRERSRSPRDRSSSTATKRVESMSSVSDTRSKAQSSFHKPRTTGSNGRQDEERKWEGGFKRGGFQGRGRYARGYARGEGFRGTSRGSSRGGMRGGGSFPNSRTHYSSDSRPSRGGGQQRRGSSGGRGDFFDSQRLKAQYQSGMQPLSGGAEQTMFLRLSGLPYTAQNTDITKFFKMVNITAVHIIPNKSGQYAGRSSGSAFIECATQSDCIKALEKHGAYLGRRYINVERCSLEDIVATLKIDVSLLTGQIPMEFNAAGLEMPSRNQTASNLVSNSLSGLTGAVPNVAEKTINLVAASANINLGDIKDGCVVGIRNLPSTTTPEEILHFFHDFPAIPDSVRIHYLDANRCSGDAMITLVNNEKARGAIRQLSGKQFGSRKIELFLL